MPRRSTALQVYQGQTVECAKLVFESAGSYKLAEAITAETDYVFQMVARATSAAAITIRAGDQTVTQPITTSFQRYIIPFPDLGIGSRAVYLDCPAGTYYIYNVQMERARNPSGWRPAPEDAEEFALNAALNAAQNAVDSQTQEDIFNLLTGGGETQGIYLLDGKVYINGSYIRAGQIAGDYIRGGTISGTTIDIGDGVFTVDSNGKVNASNLNMIGGTINLSTNQSNYDFIKLLFSYWSSEYKASGASFHYDNGVKPRGSMISPNGVAGYTNSDDSRYGYYLSNPTYDTASYSGALQLYDGVGTQRVYLADDGLYVYDASGTIRVQITSDAYILKDANGTTRMRLSESGLYFYNSSGTLTKTYSAA